MNSLFLDYDLLAKSGLFDAAFYMASNPDVVACNLDPLVHYLEQGAREGRRPYADFDPSYYLEQCRAYGESPENPLLHFVTIGELRGLKTRRDPPGPRGGPADDSSRRIATAGREPGIILTVDAVRLDSGPTGQGRRIRIEGWAIAAPTPIAEISASINGSFVGSAIYGQRRPDVGHMYPQYPKSDHSGFSIAFEHVTNDPQKSIDVELVAQTVAGVSHREVVPVGAMPLEAASGRMTQVGLRPEARLAARMPPMQLHVDDVGIDALGVLRISGWAVCFVHIARIQIYVDGECLGAAEIGGARDDVAKICPEYPNAPFSGFTFATDIGRFGAGRRTIKIEAVAQSGVSREIIAPLWAVDARPVPRTADAHDFSYNCDEILLMTNGELMVSGWAVCAAPTESVEVLFDGQILGDAEISIERADVGNRFPLAAHARRSGFAFRQSVGNSVHGEHVVTLRVRGTVGVIRDIPLPVLARDFVADVPSGLGGADTLKISVDRPLLVDGSVAAPVRGNLEIGGWALARDGVASVDVAVDGIHVLAADYGMRRMDVAATFPEWDGALTSGFFAMLPHRMLSEGRHRVSLSVRDNNDKSTKLDFQLDAEPAPESAGPWALRRKMHQSEIDLHAQVLASLDWHPKFVLLLIVPDGDDAIVAARRTLRSLRNQAYGEWRVLVVARARGREAKKAQERLLRGLEECADRIASIGRTSDDVAGALSPDEKGDGGTFVSVLEAGDELGCDALLEFAVSTAMDRGADFLYSDERRIDPASGSVGAFFKPQWSPDLLLSTNYIGRLWCARLDLLRRLGITTGDLLRHGDYDVVLRCTESAAAIRHVPSVLCERIDGPSDPAAERGALARALERRAINAEVSDGCASGHYRVKRSLATEGKVSIIIPTCAARGLIKTCIETIRAKTDYRNFEIVCIENIPPAEQHWKSWLRANADEVVEADGPFNWARFNNQAAAKASGEYLLFLNDDIEIIDGAWLGALLEHAQRTDVGAVGALLLYPDRTVQHAGMFLARMGQARHAFRNAQEHDRGYFGQGLTQRNVIAVTGACLITRRATFEALGRFDESHSVINNDLDYCLKALRGGLVNVFTPHAKLIHHELASRGAIDEAYDAAAFSGEWRDRFLMGDPYFHHRLSQDRDDYSIDWEPVEVICAGHPIARREAVRAILVVKLDHIGDCVIALPAIRRLKRHFPHAKLHVLSSRSSKPVWAAEPCIDGVLEFDFYHARSSLGPVELSEDDYGRLRQRLCEYNFDFAVDLRKSVDTRHILQSAGARFTAGFDHKGRFPWLDVALEWEGDSVYAPKRQHVGDSLINLVDAIAAACEGDRAVMAEPASGLSVSVAAGIDGKRLFARPVVCVHPAVGTEMRQWPSAYFAELIDLLVERHQVHVILIGGPDEMDIAVAVLDHVQNRRSVWNVVGAFPLADLPSVLRRCVLFVGNNSGPKHIAAGLGVPTVGIHSGVVDAHEWGPLGPRAVAMQRDMSCSPCYLTKMEDCRREFACMKGLRPGDVYRACERLLASGVGVVARTRAKAPRPSRRTS